MKTYLLKRFTVVLLLLAIGLIVLVCAVPIGKHLFAKKTAHYSIGIYTGESPFSLVSPDNIENPILTAADVSDRVADYVADPFMIRKDRTWFMFFEVLNGTPPQGDIGLAMSEDGFNFVYKQIVLDEPFHLSYPYVFEWENDYYMIPESKKANSVHLYRAENFPTDWSLVKTLLVGKYADPSILRHGGKWWLFVGSDRKGDDMLQLFYASNLMGPWLEHPRSPLVDGNPNIARPGGRVIIFGDKIIRYAQDDYPRYGNQVRAFEIIELTPTDYREREFQPSPILTATGSGWNAVGMHHIDPHQIEGGKWIACVDGYQELAVGEFVK